MRGANKVNSVFTYNAWNQDGRRLLNLTSTQVSTGTQLQNSTYDYDLVGNINTITDSLLGPQTQTFQYDELDRLTSSNVTGGTNGLYSETYSYDPATGNLASKGGVNYTAYDANHKHAVTNLSNGNSYAYDANGNMTSRNVGGQSFTLNYDAENRLVSVTGAATASFVYDADGKQVKATVNGVTTYYIGQHYEVKNSVVTKYYFAGTTRLAVRTNGTLSYLLGDHIGSSSVTTDANGAKTASALYKAFGETRYTLGNLGTDYKFTGQREEASLGIYFFNARWMDPSLGRFTSPDTIVPTSTQGTQAWDRYAFVNNNPVRYNDPTGHTAGGQDGGCDPDDDDCKNGTNPEDYYYDQLSNFGWTLEGSWSLAELKILYQVALDILAVAGSMNVMMKMFGAVTFDRNVEKPSYGGQLKDDGRISMNPDGGKWNAFGVAHELGHLWDQNSGGSLSQGLQDSVGSSYPGKFLGITFYGSKGDGLALADGGWPSRGNDYLWNKGEDFANSFAGYIYPGPAAPSASSRWGVHDWRNTPRGNYISNQIPWMYPYSY